MNKLLMAAALCVFGASAMAADNLAGAPTAAKAATVKSQQDVSPQILRIDKFKVTEAVSVNLPKFKMADGTICQSYVAAANESNTQAKPSKFGTVDVTIGEVCGLAKIVDSTTDSRGKEEMPWDLMQMRTVTSGGTSIQLPELHVSR